MPSKYVRKGYRQHGGKEKVYGRLNDLESGRVPLQDARSIEKECQLLGVAKNTYIRWGLSWVAETFDHIPPEARRGKLADFFGDGAKKYGLFRRLDGILSGEIPLDQVGNSVEESVKLRITRTSYMKWGREWVAKTFPEVAVEEWEVKFSEFYGAGAKERAANERWDAIDAGLIPQGEVGSMKQEQRLLRLYRILYIEFGEKRIAKRFPEVLAEDRKTKFRGLYTKQIDQENTPKAKVFRRLESIERGEIPLSNIGTKKEESELLDIFSETYVMHGIEWIAERNPDLTQGQCLIKLREYYGDGVKRRAVFQRLDGINTGKIPLPDVGTQAQEHNHLNICVEAYTKWGEEWVAFRFPEVPSEQRRSKLLEFSGKGIKVKRIRQMLREQINVRRGGMERMSIRRFANECHCGTVFIARIIRQELQSHGEDQGKSPAAAARSAERTFRRLFPADLAGICGTLNHQILERGLIQVFHEQNHAEDSPLITREHPERNVIHDVLVNKVQSDNWLEKQTALLFDARQTFAAKLRLTPTEIAFYSRISMDFQPWQDVKRIMEKYKKYADNNTLFFIALTAYPPKARDQVQILKDHPHMRVISAEMGFRFLGANTAALEKVNKCCTLMQRGDFDSLYAWWRRLKTDCAPPFTEGQQNLDTWLKNACDTYFYVHEDRVGKNLREGNNLQDAEVSRADQTKLGLFDDLASKENDGSFFEIPSNEKSDDGNVPEGGVFDFKGDELEDDQCDDEGDEPEGWVFDTYEDEQQEEGYQDNDVDYLTQKISLDKNEDIEVNVDSSEIDDRDAFVEDMGEEEDDEYDIDNGWC